MSQLELTIPCRSKVCRLGVGVMAVLMPFWAIIIPFCLGLFTSLILKNPHSVSLLFALFIFAIFTAIPVISVALAAIFEDDVIIVSKEGIAFPLRMLPWLGFKRERLWRDLQSVEFYENDSPRNNGPSGILALNFSQGGKARLHIERLDKEDLERLILALDIWGGRFEGSLEFRMLSESIQSRDLLSGALSHTRMWEEELSRKFTSTAFMPLEPGHQLQDGRLKVVKQLAFGGLSAIYLVQRDDSIMLVLKESVIPADVDERTRVKAEELFSREASFLAKLDHPRIARVHDHFREDNRTYLLLDYIRGQDLRQLVNQNGPQSPASVLDWGIGIAEILVYLHGQEPPVIHRDITPDNLVLTSDGKVVLIDFGAANEFLGTATGTLVGKQAYIAPEQLRGKSITGSDIYALGGTLYFLLTGQDPEALTCSKPSENDSPFPLCEIIARCTSLEPEQRPESAGEIISTLQTIKKNLDL